MKQLGSRVVGVGATGAMAPGTRSARTERRLESRRRTWRRPVGTLTLLLLASASLPLGGQEPAPEDRKADGEPSPYAEVAVGPIQQGALIDLVVEPPDGEWQVDDDGQEYIISRWPKREGEYKWVDQEAGKVRLGRLLPLTAIDHDADYFYFRIDKPKPVVEDTGPSAAEIEAVEKSYRVEVPEVDRLRLVPWEQGLPTRGQWRNGFAIADMNADGHLDLVHPPARKSFGRPVILLGDGAGSWKYWEQSSFPDLPYDYGDVAVADFDGDGHLDLALAIHLTGIVALRGDGKGGFTEWGEGLPLRADAKNRRPVSPSTTTGPGPQARFDEPVPAPREQSVEQAGIDNFSSRALEALDWNGDGRPDLVALSEGPVTLDALLGDKASPLGKVVFLNQGDGSWMPVAGPGTVHGDMIEVADLDADGRLDFVTDSSSIGNGELLNYGAGEGWESVSLPDPRTRMVAHSVAVADFDGDGRLDVAVAFKAHELGTERYGIDLFYGQPERAFRRESILGLPAGPTRGFDALAAGDVDSDGDVDLVALPREGGVWILLNEGEEGFVRELSPEADPDPDHYYCSGYRAALRDLDGDGRSELVAVFAGEPGTEILLLGQAAPRCRAFGQIRAWKIEAALDSRLDSSADGGGSSPSGS
ncbi:MAG TPA: VCBS repeat-containing protein [Thermoanaerobaculia bacterium]|nr:VCBS repeat-containing protein [Thermoanaerobaculia bacterium]